MFRNYLLVALRNLWRHKSISGINIIGLAIGIASGVLITAYILDELAYDDFFVGSENIYRLNKIVTPLSGGRELHAITSGLMGPTMATEFADIEQSVRVLPWFDDLLMTAGDDYMKVSDVVFADENIFDMFDYRLIAGDASTALHNPMSIVLTEATAERLFGRDDPLGNSVDGPFGETFQVTGVVENAPTHSHLRFNALLSWSSTVPGVGSLGFAWMNRWLTQVNYTYLQVVPGADIAQLQSQFPDFMTRHFPERADRYQLYLQPFQDIYLGSTDILFSRGIELGSELYVLILSAIALLILVIAIINFINLSLARAGKRSREIGVRKTLGASRRRLLSQFVSESVLLVSLAALVALILAEILLSPFNALTGKAISLSLTSQLWPLLSIAGGVLVLGTLAGLYPALVFAQVQPTNALRGLDSTARRASLSRRGLVTLQFSIAIALVISTLLIIKQVKFMLTKELGFQIEQVVVLPVGTTAISKQFDAFKNEILQSARIIAATGSNAVPGSGMMSFGLHPEGAPEEEEWNVSTIRVDDYDLLEVYGLELAAGRYFSPDFPADQDHAILINEALVNTWGWTDPVGKRIDIRGEVENGVVIGVLKDFHMTSLHRPIEALAVVLAPRWETMSIRIDPTDVAGTIAFMKDKWESFEKIAPFEYEFLDESFARFYSGDQRLMSTVRIFSALALVVAALGLFGLAVSVAETRTKEIGIRKVLGATVPDIMGLLSRKMVISIVLANLIALPIAWMMMKFWLDMFVYRIKFGVGILLLAGGLALLVALMTLATQAIRAATANPVESLRYE